MTRDDFNREMANLYAVRQWPLRHTGGFSSFHDKLVKKYGYRKEEIMHAFDEITGMKFKYDTFHFDEFKELCEAARRVRYAEEAQVKERAELAEIRRVHNQPPSVKFVCDNDGNCHMADPSAPPCTRDVCAIFQEATQAAMSNRRSYDGLNEEVAARIMEIHNEHSDDEPYKEPF